ncbi:MAG: SDR family oxidoreductase [Candidatus Curtissbacteria bacterium]
MDTPKIAVIGAHSMVGSRFCELWEGEAELLKSDLHGENPLDIADEKQVGEFFQNHYLDTAILFSAYTDVDGAEKQRDDKNGICWKVNVDGAKNIAEACAASGKKLIFISTDFVFDGVNGPYSEEDDFGNLDNISWYGISKIEGEKAASTLKESLIVRISYPYRAKFPQKEDIAKKFLKMYREGKLYPVFTDQVITPTFIDDLAPAAKLLIESSASGIFHLASGKTTTQFQFAKAVIETFGGNPVDVQEGSLTDYLMRDGSTPRPIKGGLKVKKIKSLGYNPTDWDEGIEIIKSQSQGQLL